MTKKHRNHYSPEAKVKILRRHLVEKEAVSDLCEELNLNPTVFYRWLKEFFEYGASAFTRDKSLIQRKSEQRITALEEKLKRKNEVLSELMEEHIQLKKDLGEL